MRNDAIGITTRPGTGPAGRRGALALAALLAAAALPAAARAETDFLELRERLEVARPTLRAGISKSLRAPDATAFPADPGGAVFRKYVDLALRSVDAHTRFPEVEAALRNFGGQVPAGDATARSALGVLLGDYLQVRYGDDIVRELRTLVAFKTYSNIVDRNSENAQFRLCFDSLAQLARALGLEVQNHDYASLAITLPAGQAGSSAPPLGMWTHIDVPRPIEHKWVSTPWTLTDRDNRLHGAGVFDDKGPLVVSLFAMRVLRDAGVRLARPIVLVVSATGEEQGADAATDIALLDPRPALVLAADGAYPYGTRELGRLVARVSSTRGMKTRTGIHPGDYYIYKLTCGQGFNTVPSESRIWVRYQPPTNTTNPILVQVTKWRTTIQTYQKEHQECVYETYVQEDTLHFFVYGTPGQTMHADGTANSLYDAAGMLQRVPLYPNSGSDIILWIHAGLQRDPTGKSLGLAFEHPEMGGTWVNPVGFDRLGEEVTVFVDIRWPLGHDAAWIRERFETAVKSFNRERGTRLQVGWEPGGLEPVESLPPRNVRDALDEAYALASGEGASAAAVTPSCARLLPAAIPFGPQAPRGVSQAHARDESISPRELEDVGVGTLAALATLATIGSSSLAAAP